MIATNKSRTISVPPPATASTRLPSPKQGTWQSTTMLSPSEIESLRQEAKESMEIIGVYLAQLRAEKASRQQSSLTA